MADTLPGLPAGFVIDDTPPPQQYVSSGSRTLPAGFALETPDLFSGLTDQAARAFTFGLADPVTAAGRAAVQKFGLGEEKPFGDLYQRNLAQQRGEGENFATAHPVPSALATGIGALASVKPPAPAAVPGLFRQMGQGAAIGGVAGAANALAASPNSDLASIARDAGIGAVGGAAVGAGMAPVTALANRPVSALARALVPGAVDRQAAQLIGGRIGQDAAAGGPAAGDIGTRLATAGTSPLSIADVGGANVQGLAGRFARMQGEPREIAENFLADRASGMAPRLIQNIDQNLQSGNAFQAAESLVAQRKAAAAPLYQAAYSAPPLNPDTIAAGGELDRMMSRPSMQQAATRALSIAREEGRDPASLGITFNVAGDPVFERVPSWQTLDYVKRGLDDVLNSYREPLTGKLVLDEGGNAVNSTRKAFLDFLDRENPDYATARQAWAGPTQALAAMKQGQNFRQMRPELIEQTLNGMSPSEQEFFRLGAADSLRTAVGQTGTAAPLIGSNAVNQRGADYRQQQLRPLFPSQDAFDRFVQNATNENLIFANTGKFIGNSATAARLAEDAGGHGSSGTLANIIAGVAALPHEPIAGAGLLMRAIGKLNAFPEGNNPRVNAAAARMLFNADPTANQQTLASVLAGRAPVRMGLTVPAAGYAGSLYPQLEFSPFAADKPKPMAAGAQ